MHYLNATTADLTALRKAISDKGLHDVHVSPPFLGKVIVQCPNEETADKLRPTIHRQKTSL